jgi:hypothetical protein
MNASPPLTIVDLDPTKIAKEKSKKARGGKKSQGASLRVNPTYKR